MSDRIDHKAEARKWLDPAVWEKEGATDESVPVLVAVAQVHATLAQVAATEALAEQQRIANLIALASGGDETAYLVNGETNKYDENRWRALRAEIREGLGL